jgi:preprotein translocase subunit YajC
LVHWLLHPVLLQAAPSQGWADPSFFVPIIGVVAVFYFVMLRPQQKQAAQHKQMLGGLKKGDAIITQSGMFGRVVSLGDKDLVLEIAIGGGSTKVRWLKSQILGRDPSQKAETEGSTEQKS